MAAPVVIILVIAYGGWDDTDFEEDGGLNSTSSTPNPLPVATLGSRKWPSRLFRKRDRSSARDSSSGTVTSQATSATSIPTLDQNEALQAANAQDNIVRQLQQRATLGTKARWIGQEEKFAEHLREINASNNFIRDIVSIRTLGSIRNATMVPEFKGDIPKDILVVRDSLHRLHTALVSSNQGNPDTKPMFVSIRVMEADAYVQLKRRLATEHDYINFRQGSALFPLQIESLTGTESTVVLAETVITTQESPSAQTAAIAVVPLYEMLAGQRTDIYEPWKDIGSVPDTTRLSEAHRLYQDIGISWIVQDTLADLLRSTSKFRTYLQLALQVAVSYMYITAIGLSYRYPRLVDYRYYKPLTDAKRCLRPDEVLEPYLSIGFGSRLPRKSTLDIGGTSIRLRRDEAMINLGLILHELGCWKMLDEDDTSRARDTAKEQRKDLQASTGILYTQLVDLCFEAKMGEWEPRARADNIYKKIVAPLQKLVSELGWD